MNPATHPNSYSVPQQHTPMYRIPVISSNDEVLPSASYCRARYTPAISAMFEITYVFTHYSWGPTDNGWK